MLELTATLGILPIYQNCSTNINWAWRTNFCKVTYLDHCHNHWCSDISAHNIQPERTESSFILYLRLMFTFSIDVNFPAIALLLAAASEMMSRGGVLAQACPRRLHPNSSDGQTGPGRWARRGLGQDWCSDYCLCMGRFYLIHFLALGAFGEWKRRRGSLQLM